MRLSSAIAAFGFSLAVAACQPPNSNTVGDNQAAEEAPVADAGPATPCPVSAHGDWRAVLREGGTPALSVSGSIELPTPGYSVSLARDPSETRSTTEPRLTLSLSPPAGMVTQVLTEHPVYYFAPASGAYTTIHIICEGQPLTDIAVTAE